MSGVRDPKKLSEQIIVKLIYQGLAMGGLHISDSRKVNVDVNLNSVSNDVHNLPSESFKKLLVDIASEMSLQVQNLIDLRGSTLVERLEISNIEREYESIEHDMIEGHHEIQETNQHISEENSDYGSRHTQSDDGGWFYEDD